MVKMLANKCMAFHRNEKDASGHLIRYKTKVGFCELPDWVEQTDLYKAAVADGSLQPFVSSAESEAVLKEQEKLAALKAEVAEWEEKKAAINKRKKNSLGDSNNPDAGTDGTGMNNPEK